jgi:transcription-repair coupling factor (superfamily II helicase)
MIDRFGLLPDQVKALFAITELKQQAAHLGIKKIEAFASGGRIIFNSNPQIDAGELITMIQSQSQVYKFDGADKLRFNHTFKDMEDKVAFLHKLLVRMQPKS